MPSDLPIMANSKFKAFHLMKKLGLNLWAILEGPPVYFILKNESYIFVVHELKA